MRGRRLRVGISSRSGGENGLLGVAGVVKGCRQEGRKLGGLLGVEVAVCEGGMRSLLRVACTVRSLQAVAAADVNSGSPVIQ